MKIDDVKKAVKAFMIEMDVSRELAGPQHVCLVMLMLINQYADRAIRKHILGLSQSQLDYVNDNCIFFDDIFRKNTHWQRETFFQNPLCQVLWAKFLKDDPRALLNCVRYVKSDKL